MLYLICMISFYFYMEIMQQKFNMKIMQQKFETVSRLLLYGIYTNIA